MSKNGEHSPGPEERNPSFLQRNLADSLTLSRVIIGVIILSLSFVGKSAYLTAVVLTLVGAATDMLDGRVARHYFGDERERKTGETRCRSRHHLCSLHTGLFLLLRGDSQHCNGS